MVVAEEPLGDADELEAEGGVLDTFEPPPFDVEDDLDLSGAFLLAFLIPDVSCFLCLGAFWPWKINWYLS